MHAGLQQVVRQINASLRGLDRDNAQEHPGGCAHDWSVQQVVEHLILTYRATTRQLESRLRKGRSRRKLERTWLQWSLKVMVLRFGKLPSGVPALDESRPSPGEFEAMDGEDLGALLYAEMQLMDAAIERCRSKFGRQQVAYHPWFGPLRVDQLRRYHLIHGAHHGVQIRSAIKQVATGPVPLRITTRTSGKKLQVPLRHL